ncbi:Putative transcriptional regulatory protein C15D4.02 [Fusarium oxysporum f. sp. cubense race 1]|uniref:Putative transcriptional regulatory protein C15D4.02 n=1 Tax=Fusarium oxysporum f. sp. cubense (strain race 1) TaxID=1229664 RepID=N4UB78_FUSC1|nr:Putative transcriptional regulatory protein C15D4.02 [Fusarium oxysporum f. sp. cubense race 1]
MEPQTQQLPISFELSSISSKPKLTRTSASKVRTGCVTCKKRHVKCDEAKPHCRNCVRNNRQCGGYAIPDRKRNKGPGQFQWDSKRVTWAAPLKAQLHLVQDSLDFRDAQSVLYFDEFIQVVQSPWISAGFNSDLWSVTLPQVARTNDIVRHAAIAIGALSKWLAKSEYDSLDSALMTSIAPNPKPLIAVVADIFSQLLPQTRLILRGNIGRSPAVPNFTRGLRAKKHTVESFMSMVNQIPRDYPPTEELPPVLDNLDDFEKYWLTGRNAKLAVVPLLMEAVQSTGVLVSSDPDIISRVWKEITADPRIKEICEASTKELRALEAAFMPLFNRAIMSDAKSTDYIRAIHLRLHYLGTCTFDDLTHFYDVEPIQAKTPLFREFLSLAEISIRIAKRDLKNPAQQLSLQCNMASHLFLIALFCRDALLRDEATWLLKDYPGQDGIWNARSLYLLSHRNKIVERINASEGTAIEQWHRLLRREYLFEEGGDRVIFCYLDKDEITGEWQLVEETAVVKGELDAIEWKRRPPSAAGRPLLGDIITLWPELVE